MQYLTGAQTTCVNLPKEVRVTHPIPACGKPDGRYGV